MADGIGILWTLIESFLSSIVIALRVDVLEAILIALFEQFFTFIFVTLGNNTIGFMLVFCTFMLVFYWRFVRV